ncbi:MAG: GAF domain-containing protein [Polyangia bacterium]
MASLGRLLRTLAARDSLQSILEATLEFLRPWRPHFARIIGLHADAHGRPAMGQLLAQWADGGARAVPGPSAELHPLSDYPLVSAWNGHLSEPVLLADIRSEPGMSESLRAQVLSAGHGAAVLLPIYIESYGGWQGVLKIFWAQPREFSHEEREFYGVLMTALSMHIGGLASQKRLGSALDDLAIVHHVGQELNLSRSFAEALRALLQPAPAADEASVVLCAIETDADGQPEWLKIISGVSPPGKPEAHVGARFRLADIPFARLYMSSPDVPLLIRDVTTDERVDSHARALYAASGTRSTMIIALTLQGRWVGLLNISWHRQVEFSDRELHVYQALAKHIALRLDHAMIVERLHAALAETRQKGTLLQTVLDSVPVGLVLVEFPSMRPVLSNPAAARLLGRRGDEPATSADQYTQTYGFLRPGTDEPFPNDELPLVRSLRSGTAQSAELDVRTATEERRSLEVTSVPMRDGAGAMSGAVVVLSNVTARKHAEEERRRMQEETLRMQAAALAERSSPLIPITDDILVLPIIGSIDTERGQQVLNTVLEGAAQKRARVAIIDITGVRTLDTQAAAALTGAAQALRLLGVLPILTGIKAEVAQTLVGLGIALAGIATRSTLQSGIQYALRHLGKSGIQ